MHCYPFEGRPFDFPGKLPFDVRKKSRPAGCRVRPPRLAVLDDAIVEKLRVIARATAQSRGVG